MRIGLAIAGFVLLSGCGATERPLLHAVDAAVPGDDSGALGGAGTSSGATGIAQDMAWQYQLVGTVDTSVAADLFVIDLFEVTAELIDGLHTDGKLAVAYLSAGTFETYRPDAERFPEAALGRPLAAYPQESWLDVRDPTVRMLMAERLALARTKGFDGVLPTSLTGYRQDSGFELTADDQTDYTAFLAAQAHALELDVGMSGDFGRAAELSAHFDFAVDFGCIARGACTELDSFRTAAKPVFDVEVEGDAAEVCASAADQAVNAILKRPDFGAFRVGCQ